MNEQIDICRFCGAAAVAWLTLTVRGLSYSRPECPACLDRSLTARETFVPKPAVEIVALEVLDR